MNCLPRFFTCIAGFALVVFLNFTASLSYAIQSEPKPFKPLHEPREQGWEPNSTIFTVLSNRIIGIRKRMKKTDPMQVNWNYFFKNNKTHPLYNMSSSSASSSASSSSSSSSDGARQNLSAISTSTSQSSPNNESYSTVIAQYSTDKDNNPNQSSRVSISTSTSSTSGSSSSSDSGSSSSTDSAWENGTVSNSNLVHLTNQSIENQNEKDTPINANILTSEPILENSTVVVTSLKNATQTSTYYRPFTTIISSFRQVSTTNNSKPYEFQQNPIFNNETYEMKNDILNEVGKFENNTHQDHFLDKMKFSGGSSSSTYAMSESSLSIGRPMNSTPTPGIKDNSTSNFDKENRIKIKKKPLFNRLVVFFSEAMPMRNKTRKN